MWMKMLPSETPILTYWADCIFAQKVVTFDLYYNSKNPALVCYIASTCQPFRG